MPAKRTTETGAKPAKEAAKLAADYFRTVTGYADVLSVEEVEFDKKKGICRITLGYIDNPDSAFLTGLRCKAWKSFDVNMKSKQVLGMKVRKF